MYWVVFLIIIFYTLFEIRSKQINHKAFDIVYVILTLMVVLRRGQGTDYTSYQVLYSEISETPFVLLFIGKDPLFSIICAMAQYCKCSYELFSALFSLVIMCLCYPFFSRECHKSMVALFLFYTTIFLIYPFNVFRQGLAMSVLGGVLYLYIKKKKWVAYYAILILLSGIHNSVLICAILPLVYNIKIDKTLLGILMLGATLYMFMVSNGIFPGLRILIDLDRVNVYQDAAASFKNIMTRVIMLLPIFLVPNHVYRFNTELNGLKNILVFGYVIYAIFSFNTLVSSRMFDYFFFFCGLFVILLLYASNLRTISRQIGVYYIIISSILFVNDIKGFIEQGGYQNCSVWTYPYLSVFETTQQIQYYRPNF